MKRVNYSRWLTWGLGKPGATQESIFGAYLPDIDPMYDFNPSYFRVGIDLGYADSPVGHPTVAVLTGIDRFSRCKPLKTYYHSNAKKDDDWGSDAHLSTTQICHAIINFVEECGRSYPQLIFQGLECWVDWGAGGIVMIDNLNNSKKSG